VVKKELKGLALTPIIRLRAPAFDSCYLMVMVGGRWKPYEPSIPWVAPMAVMRRAFSALVKHLTLVFWWWLLAGGKILWIFKSISCTHGCYWTRLQRYCRMSLCETLLYFVPLAVKYGYHTQNLRGLFVSKTVSEEKTSKVRYGHFQLSHFRLLTSYFSFLTLAF